MWSIISTYRTNSSDSIAISSVLFESFTRKNCVTTRANLNYWELYPIGFHSVSVSSLPSEDRWQGRYLIQRVAWLHPLSWVLLWKSQSSPGRKVAGGDRLLTLPGKQGSLSLVRTKTEDQLWPGRRAEAPLTPLCGLQSWDRPSPVGCAHPTSGSSAPSTWGQAPREARGKGRLQLQAYSSSWNQTQEFIFAIQQAITR